VVIVECENANITYDRENNSIVAILKENSGGIDLDKLFPKIEYAFSRYNAKFLISDCSIITDKIRESLNRFVKNLIKSRIEKIAFVNKEASCDVNLSEIEALSNCETRVFPSLVAATAWIQSGTRKINVPRGF